MEESNTINELKKNIKACTFCEADLPYSPKPIFSFSENSKILIVGQAPGMKAVSYTHLTLPTNREV